ncbi:MAG: MBL fold metallo-hydrolase [Halobacteriovoraceae bacterium]|nr:MBL fold metallo-hydrolase [Halobacteriovoraceae bacterium]
MITAVAAILTFKNKIFVIKRNEKLRAFPGYTSFPGGKVDEGENLLQALERELKEELDFDISSAQKKGEIKKIVEFGKAQTPGFNPIRFATHYFKIELQNIPRFDLNSHEIALARWEMADYFMDDFNQGNLLMVPPVRTIISLLAKDHQMEGADVQYRYDEDSKVPMIEFMGGIRQLLVRSHTLPPALYTNAFIIGDENKGRVLVDPSPKDEKEFVKLQNTIEDQKIEGVFLTHHHADHNQQVDRLASLLKIPVKLSEDSFNRIKKREGNNYFKGLEVRFFREGDVLNTSLGEEVICLEVPGHDEGQLALAPRSYKWCLVGDLIQTVGTVVVGGEEGNMKKYFNSLQRIIELAPRFVMPSHGNIMGGVEKLQLTLSHRQNRETQILDLFNQGKTAKQMLDIIYQGVDEKLLPFAMENIKSHLKKLGLSYK